MKITDTDRINWLEKQLTESAEAHDDGYTYYEGWQHSPVVQTGSNPQTIREAIDEAISNSPDQPPARG